MDHAGWRGYPAGTNREAVQRRALHRIPLLRLKYGYIQLSNSVAEARRDRCRRMEPLACLSQFAAFMCQLGEILPWLTAGSCLDGCRQLRARQVEHVVWRVQRAGASDALPQFEREPSQYRPGGAHIKERLLAVRAEAL